MDIALRPVLHQWIKDGTYSDLHCIDFSLLVHTATKDLDFDLDSESWVLADLDLELKLVDSDLDCLLGLYWTVLTLLNGFSFFSYLFIYYYFSGSCGRLRLANSGYGHSGTPSPPFPSLPVPPLPSLLFPSPPSFPFHVGPTPKPARWSGERCKLPQWVWGKAPADKRFGTYIWAKRSSSSGNSFCAFL